MYKEGKVACDACKRRIRCDERYYHVIAFGPRTWEVEGCDLCEACWQKARRFLEGGRCRRRMMRSSTTRRM